MGAIMGAWGQIYEVYDYAPMSHYFTGNTTTMGVTIGFVHMLELSHGGTVWRWPGDQM